MTTPLPSKLVFLSQLCSLPSDSKVRFLGCVRTYNFTTGHLILEHNYPPQAGKDAIIAVDINPLLETITAEELRVGAWVNVLGYVRKPVQGTGKEDSVEAVMVFPAGPVSLGEYERTVRNAQDVDLARGLRYLASFLVDRVVLMKDIVD